MLDTFSNTRTIDNVRCHIKHKHNFINCRQSGLSVFRRSVFLYTFLNLKGVIFTMTEKKGNHSWKLDEILNPLCHVGDNVVFYDVESRKVLFFYRDSTGYRLKQICGKRRLPMNVRPSDVLVKRMSNGSIICGAENIPELVPLNA